MTWLFERTTEFAAWVALTVSWACAILALVWLVKWAGTLRADPDWDLLWQSAEAATASVSFAVALGVLACIDRFLFDADTPPTTK
jgi:hypothetical protein